MAFLNFCCRLERGLPQCPNEREINTSAMRLLLLKCLVREDVDLVKECLRDLAVAYPDLVLPEPWMDRFPETLELFRNLDAASPLASASNPARNAKTILRCQASLALALLEAVAAWPVRPDQIRASLQGFVGDLDLVNAVFRQQKAAIEARLEELHREKQVLYAQGLFWRIFHYTEFQEQREKLTASTARVLAELEDVEKQIVQLRDNALLPWVMFALRWLFVLRQIAQASNSMQQLHDAERTSLELLHDCAREPRGVCDDIKWLDFPPRLNVVARDECEKLLAADEKHPDELYASWLTFPQERPEYVGAAYARIRLLAEFTDGKLPVLINKLADFALDRLSRYRTMDLKQVVSIAGAQRLLCLLENSFAWLSPWLILNAGQCHAQGKRAPVSVCYAGVTAKDREFLESAVSEQAQQISCFETDLAHEISILHATCGVPAFLLTGLLPYRMAWSESGGHQDDPAIQAAVNDMFPEGMI